MRSVKCRDNQQLFENAEKAFKTKNVGVEILIEGAILKSD